MRDPLGQFLAPRSLWGAGRQAEARVYSGERGDASRGHDLAEPRRVAAQEEMGNLRLSRRDGVDLASRLREASGLLIDLGS